MTSPLPYLKAACWNLQQAACVSHQLERSDVMTAAASWQ